MWGKGAPVVSRLQSDFTASAVGSSLVNAGQAVVAGTTVKAIEEHKMHLMRVGGSMFEKGVTVVLREVERLNSMHIATRMAIDHFRREHPVEARRIAIGLVVVGSVVVLPAVGGLILNVVGFTTTGVAAGTLATVIQSAVYGPLTCGVFSVAQSIGATGLGVLVPFVLFGAPVLAAGVTMLLARNRTGFHPNPRASTTSTTSIPGPSSDNKL